MDQSSCAATERETRPPTANTALTTQSVRSRLNASTVVPLEALRVTPQGIALSMQWTTHSVERLRASRYQGAQNVPSQL